LTAPVRSGFADHNNAAHHNTATGDVQHRNDTSKAVCAQQLNDLGFLQGKSIDGIAALP
jgi:hypothetical protein